MFIRYPNSTLGLLYTSTGPRVVSFDGEPPPPPPQGTTPTGAIVFDAGGHLTFNDGSTLVLA